ncbi:TIGR04222 domain-containing membrane protein [Plantactinospora sp. WMMB334]|uniref:TIGR04222 domain-containing membrane protein n=1 Tax=Plantactinospora sp. WMMB334 TaxID=3404119 RepID=UPI003B94A54A
MTLLLALVAIIPVGLVLRARHRAREALDGWLPQVRQRQWRPAFTGDPLAELGPYEMAYLTGGSGHAVDTALVTLHRKRSVRISREGEVSAVTGEPRPPKPLEQAIMDRLTTGPQPVRSAADLRAALRHGSEMLDIHRRLERLGMLTSDDAVKPTSTRLAELLAASIGAVVLPWLLVLAAAFLPVDAWPALGAALLGTAVGGLGIRAYLEGRRAVDTLGEHGGWHGEKHPSHRIAPALRDALLRRSDEISRGPGQRRALVPVALAVALGGLVMLDDPTLETALRPPAPEGGGTAGGCGGCGGGCGGCGCGG